MKGSLHNSMNTTSNIIFFSKNWRIALEGSNTNISLLVKHFLSMISTTTVVNMGMSAGTIYPTYDIWVSYHLSVMLKFNSLYILKLPSYFVADKYCGDVNRSWNKIIVKKIKAIYKNVIYAVMRNKPFLATENVSQSWRYTSIMTPQCSCCK